jgi:hypothetical protein
MSYAYHVFVSYRRQALWTPWTRDQFKPLLEAYLQQELGQRPEIFVDERLQFGRDYVEQLGKALAQSRILVAVLSRDYFGSQWCQHELDLMLGRASGQPGLVFAVVAHDCERLPQPINRAQTVDLKVFRIAGMNQHAPKYTEFSEAIGRFTPDLREVIRDAPAYDPQWEQDCVNRLMQVYEAEQRGDTVAPTWYVPPNEPPLVAMPRLIP